MKVIYSTYCTLSGSTAGKNEVCLFASIFYRELIPNETTMGANLLHNTFVPEKTKRMSV